MSSPSPTKPIRDVEIAGQFARKFFGKFGMARARRIRIPSSPKNSYTVYEIGTCSQVGDFVIKSDSSYDFAEAFFSAGFPLNARDPLFLRSDLKFCNELAERENVEQVEMAI